MIGLIQRVTEASVRVGDGQRPDGTLVGQIAGGLLALVCAERHDTEREADRLLERMLGYRVFADQAGKMNRSLIDVGGELLIVSQFTLAADTSSGTRPSFTPAAPPALGERLYERIVQRAHQLLDTDRAAGPDARSRVAAGRFGADMKVSLVNDGPVTFWLRVPPAAAAVSLANNTSVQDGVQRA